MRSLKTAATFALCASLALAQPPGVISPLAKNCGSSIVCINQYAAVMPYHFFRNVSDNDIKYEFGDTEVPDSSFAQVKSADFLVFDKERGMELLGPNPSYKYVFNVSMAVHEAPVYAPVQNKLFLSQLAPPPGFLPQLVVDLNQNPPTLSEFLSDPPVYANNGGTFRNGLIVWGASGGNNSIGGGEQRVSLRTLDPATNKTNVLLNNYYGLYFNTIDDVAIHPVTKDIFFTDPDYSWFNALTDTAPQLPTASYRFNPATGATFLIDDTISQPNGIAFNPEGTTLYISDTGAVSSSVTPSLGSIGTSYNATHHRTIYAYDVSPDGTKVTAKRPFYLAQSWIPDGLKVARNGYVVTATGNGVDVMDDKGQLLVRVQTNYTVQNFAWTGSDYKTLWLTGNGGISRVEWNLQGQELK